MDQYQNDVLCFLHFMYNENFSAHAMKIWPDDPDLAEHISSKWADFCSTYTSTGAPGPFFCALDVKCRQRLTEYACSRYRK